MKKYVLLVTTFCVIVSSSYAQLLTWSPQFPSYNSPVTITLNDATLGNGALAGNITGPIYVHIGLITTTSANSSAWEGAPVWLTNTTQYQATLVGGKWTFTLTPSTFGWTTSVPVTGTPLKIAILFRNATGTVVQKNADGGDMFVPLFTAGGNFIQITNPLIVPSYTTSIPANTTPITTATIGQSIPFSATASNSGTLTFTLNGTQFASATGTTISGNATAVGGNNQVIAFLNGVASDTVNFYVSPPTVVQALPAGVVEGINYYGCTDSVTLVLYAPNKTSSMLIGDFPGSNWTSQAQYQMNKTPDGNYYWLTIHGLTSGTQYAYQYLVDNSIYIADPYAEVILDGNNDKLIPTATYPGLKAYPTNSNVSVGQNGLISVLQTCAPQYTWQVPNFTPPDKKNLIIEEVLVRDFATVDGNGNFQLLLDSLHYFKSLGINAIQLMPISEFSGNDSWGYNPNFYCALDKAYGTKAMYKTFIDSCHANGIAVIMDVVYNQVDDNNIQVPEAKLYWDATNSRPAANNPWLNPAAPHPYGVFDDLNHTSTATQYWVERSLSYWLTEYHVDGFRFDLAKGFTQNCTNGVNAECPGGNNSSNSSVENYDASRVQNLERYYDYVQSNHPGSTMPYMILEFLGTQNSGNPSSEESAYANYGFMLWNDVNQAFPQNTEGFASNSNLSKAVYNSNDESFSVPASDSYMNSHDDQRTMYNTENYGANAVVKSISGVGGALQRQAAAAALLFMIPGPHMFYEFDERGYDLTEGNGNTSYSPPHWEYLTTDANATGRVALVNIYTKLIKLRLSNPNTFNNTASMNYDLYNSGGLVRRFQIGDPSLANLQVTVVANFDITAKSVSVTFQKTGNWINYVSNGSSIGINGTTGTSFNIATAAQTITLNPGEYHVYISCTAPSNPVAQANGLLVDSVCAGSTINLTATTISGATYAWTGPSYTSTTQNPVITGATTAMSGKYSVIATVGGCSSNADTAIVTVNALPATPTITAGGTTALCAGSNVLLTSSAASGNQWLLNGSAIGAATNQTYTASTAGNYTVTVTTGTCTSAASIAKTVTVTAIPVIGGSTSTNPTTCSSSDGSITLSGLTASTSYFLSYSKNGASATTSTVSSNASGNILITNLSAANYTNITVGVNSCTSNAVSASLISPSAPSQPTITAGSTTTFCAGGNVVLTSSAASGNQWYLGGTLIAGETNTTYSATNNGNYTVITTVTGCASIASATTVVTVNPIPSQPTVTAGGTTALCSGSNVVLTSSAASGNQWLLNGSTIGGETNQTYTASAAGNYSVTSTANGCSSIASLAKTITVTAVPVIGGSSSVNPSTCTGADGSITLTGLTASTSYFLSYSKNGAPTTTSTVSSDASGNIIITNLSAANYTNIGVGLNSSCTSNIVSALLTNPSAPSQPTITAGSVTTFCFGNNVILSSSAATGNQWSNGGAAISGATNVSYTATETGNYTVTTTVSTCTSIPSTSIPVTVNQVSTPTVTTNGTTDLCSGTSAVLTSSAVSGNQWLLNGSSISGEINQNYTVNSTGNYTVIATVAGCSSLPSSPVAITVIPTPDPPADLTAVPDFNSAVLTWTNVSGVYYTVNYKADTATAWINIANGITSNSVTISDLIASTKYDWQVSANCTNVTIGNYTDADFTTSSHNSTITNLKNGFGLKISPNPVNSSPIVDYIVPGNGTVTLSVINTLGQRLPILFSEVQSAGHYQLQLGTQLSNLPGGVYILHLQQNNSNGCYLQFIKP